MRTSYLSYLTKEFKEGNYLILPRTFYRYLALIASRKFNRSFAGPLHASIIPTYQCNLRCGMCELWERPIKYKKENKKELTLDEFKKVIDDLASIGTSGVGFTGGEPILYSNIIELIKYTKDKGLVTHMSTNGFLMNKENVRRIINSGLDAVSFSLDGINPETHDKVRGVKGSYNRVINGIKNFIELKKELNSSIVVIVVCLISKYNLNEIKDLVEYLKKLNVDNISFIPFHDIGLLESGNEKMSDFKVSDLEKLDEVINYLIEVKKKDKIIESSVNYLKLFKSYFRNKPLPIKCYAGYATIAIDVYGDVYPCFPKMEGNDKNKVNLKHLSLKQFWKSKQLNEIRKKIKDCRSCYWNNQTEINLLFNLKRIK